MGFPEVFLFSAKGEGNRHGNRSIVHHHYTLQSAEIPYRRYHRAAYVADRSGIHRRADACLHTGNGGTLRPESRGDGSERYGKDACRLCAGEFSAARRRPQGTRPDAPVPRGGRLPEADQYHRAALAVFAEMHQRRRNAARYVCRCGGG